MKRNKFNYSFRVILLFVLILLMFYQLFDMYLKDTFLNFHNNLDSSDQVKNYEILNEALPFTRPASMAIGIPESNGEVKFIKRTSVNYDEIYKSALNLMKMFATKSTYETKAYTGELEAIAPIYMDYNFTMTMADYFAEIGYVLPGELKEIAFERIIIEVFQNEIRFHLVSRKNGLGTTYIFNDLNEDELNNMVLVMQKQLESVDVRAMLVSPQEEPAFIAPICLYKPETEMRLSEYYYFVNPIADASGRIDDIKVKSYIEPFFEFTDQVWEVHPKEDFLFGNDLQTVRLTQNGLMEYVDKEIYPKRAPDLLYDYSQVLSFLEKDNYVNEIEYTLSGYAKDETGIWFYFDYSLNDLPITIDMKSLPEPDLCHPMAARVENGKVITFRRILLLGEENTGQLENMNLDYRQALDTVARTQPDVKIKDMELCYDLSLEDWAGRISWRIVSDESSPTLCPGQGIMDGKLILLPIK